MKIIISLGGSVVSPKNIVDHAKTLTDYVNFLSDLSKHHTVGVIVGGGQRARTRIEAEKLKNPQVTSEDLDWIGIKATHENAQALLDLFSKEIKTTYEANPVFKLPEENGLFISGGLKPGNSTDYCAILLAIENKVKEVFNISNISYVYNKDPNKYHDAQPLLEMSWKLLRSMVGDKWSPGLSAPFDPIAAQTADLHKMTVKILNGNDVNNVKNAVLGNTFKGTIVHP